MSERVYTADVVVIAEKHLLLIQRRKDPFAGMWALPGGKQQPGEDSFYQTAARELHEETGILASRSQLGCIGLFDAPGRDPRGHYVSIAFLLVLDERPEVQAGDDAASAQWFALDELPDLAFDHSEIIAAAMLEATR